MPIKVPDAVADALAEIAVQPDVLVMLSERTQMAVSRYVARRRSMAEHPAAPKAAQLALDLREISPYRRRGKRQRHQAKYPIEMVEDAKVMRANEYTYAEIAEALYQLYGKRVHVMTVRDWVCGYYRALR
ncbi:hypothetical protein JN531_003795 [Flagellatimonas centrodinii]|uniref:hypothetical protein n=1 Tax=Flagellatimonas centrodinii TaxID=2806210 RepID=UPI001FF05A93|nr:hypothetical protein [Flagellatimonas centrodinii]ULQ47410.1 hypothetical protein JN531_003795 [Flagellatimonas centrodinii]